MYREKIKENSLVVVNGREYIIQSLIGRGGCSLVYQAIEKENALHPWTIKEFFPQNQLAYRESMKDSAEYGKVCCGEGQETVYSRLRNCFFHQEATLGNAIKNESFQVYSFDSIDEEKGFAVMRPFSKDTVSLLELVKFWETDPPVIQDPYYSTMGRVSYALHIAEALLVFVEKMHQEGILHLDLSYNNVAWAGLDRENHGVHSNVFILDFGCAVNLDEGRYYKEEPLDYSYSIGFSAPEISDPIVKELDCRADLYSVSALLFFLCAGKDAVTNAQWKMMDKLWRNLKWIRNGVKKLDVPEEIKDTLCEILIKGCAKDPADRYQNATSMRAKVHGLKVLVENYRSEHLLCRPVRPISQGFIPRTRELMEEIETRLFNHRICVLCGMSGVGKSETARQYAQYSTSLVYEILLPEMIVGQHYDWEKEIKKLHISSGDDKADKSALLREFLNKESSLLIMHNFNTVDTYLFRELMDAKAPVIITSQCAPHEFERCNDFLAEMCIDLSRPNQKFLRNVFLAQFKKDREFVAEQMDSVDTIIRGLFYNTMLIHTTALQLSEHPNRGMVTELAKELSHSISLAETYLDTPGIIYEKDYDFPVENGEEEQNPFDIAMAVVAKILPKLTEMQKKVLQLLSVCPGEWQATSDVCMYLGDDINSRRGRIYPEIRKLQRRHLLETRIIDEEEEILLHPMMQQVMFHINVENGRYLDVPALEFYEHVERNMFSSCFDLEKRQRIANSEFRFDNDYFSSTRHFQFLQSMLVWCADNELISLSEFNSWYLGNHRIFEISIPDNGLEIKKAHIYSNNGIIFLEVEKEHTHLEDSNGIKRKRFRVVFDAENQLAQRYYIGSSQGGKKLSVDEGVFVDSNGYTCSVLMEYDLNKGSDSLEIPQTFGGIPIHYIEYMEVNSSATNIESFNSDKTKLYDLILPDTCNAFDGRYLHIRHLYINEGLTMLKLPENCIEELKIPASLIKLSDQSITPFLRKMSVNENNEHYLEDNGLVYTADKKKLLFIPHEKRKMSINIPPEVTEINLCGLGYRKETFLLSKQSIATIERLINRINNLSDLERLLYTTVNECSIEQIRKTAIEIYNSYKQFEIGREVPFYFKYVISGGNISRLNDCDQKEYESYVEQYLELAEMWMKVAYGKSDREVDPVQQLNPINISRVYNLLLDEDIYNPHMRMLSSLDLFTIDCGILEKAINRIKEQYSCESLHTLFSINSENIIENELLETCGVI